MPPSRFPTDLMMDIDHRHTQESKQIINDPAFTLQVYVSENITCVKFLVNGKIFVKLP